MLRLKALTNNKGFIGIAQALVSAVIVAIVSLAIAAIISDFTKSQKSIKLTNDLENLASSVKIAFSKNAICNYNLLNFSTTTFDRTQLATTKIGINKIVLPSSPSQPLAVNAATLPGDPNTSVTLSIENIMEIQANVTYMGNLKFTLNKDVGGLHVVQGATQVYRSIPLFFDTTASGNIETIQNCYSLSGNITSQDLMTIDQYVCASLGGVMNGGTCVLPSQSLSAAQKADMCSSLNGSWDSSTGKCSLPPPPASTPIPAPTPTGKWVVDVRAGPSIAPCGGYHVIYSDGTSQDFMTFAGCSWGGH